MSYIFVEFSFFNKLFDEEEWETEIILIKEFVKKRKLHEDVGHLVSVEYLPIFFLTICKPFCGCV
ncbi:MAG: hypothetical protein AAFV78_19615, partial [Bacteroidota bacterium]